MNTQPQTSAAGRTVLTDPPRLPLIAPSILSADFARLGEECRHVLADPPGGAGADLLHVDVMDGHFVPNLTMGPAIVAALRAELPNAGIDVHVMVTDPEQYIRPFADAGADHLTFHLEPALDPHAGTGMSPLSGGGSGYDPRDVASTIRSAGMTPGIAINPNTPADRLLDGPLGPDLVEAFDLVLVMSVMPGFSGQAFKPEALDTAQAVRSAVGDRVRVQMDGGVNVETAPRALESGVDVLVAASAIFNAPAPERSDVVRKLRGS